MRLAIHSHKIRWHFLFESLLKLKRFGKVLTVAILLDTNYTKIRVELNV